MNEGIGFQPNFRIGIMSDTHKKIRLFVGSPGDVAEERDAVSDVVERLNSELDRDDVGVFFQTIRWEKYAHFRDTRFTPQAAIARGIPRPRDCEVAVFIFWRRIGTVLDMTNLEPNGAGERPTGSTWEFYDALESNKTKVITYRKTAPAPAVHDESSAQFEERQRQEREVHQLFASFRDAEGGYKSYWFNFAHLAEFKADLHEQLRIIAKQAVSEPVAPSDSGNKHDEITNDTSLTVSPPAQPGDKSAESSHPASSETDQFTTSNSENKNKTSKTYKTRWAISGMAAALIVIGSVIWYINSPNPSPKPLPEPTPSPEPLPEPTPSPESLPEPTLSSAPEKTTFPKPDLVPIPSRDFNISRHEITFEQYDHYAEQKKIDLPEDEGWGRGNRPVINISMKDAKAYTGWLSDKLDQQCRLPSEDEWEYAARAGGSGEYGLGKDGVEITQDNLGDYAWYWVNAERKTHPVGEKKPNAWGLYDMFGNVWEWCGNDGRLCGGSWFNNPDGLRAADRYGVHPDIRVDYVGFRVVCVPHS